MTRRSHHPSRSGGRCAPTETPRPRGRVAPLALPARCATALTTHHERQGQPPADHLVFPSAAGMALDRHNVLRAFRLVVAKAGLDPRDWTPRELRHSFVSLLSDSGVSIEQIADLCGHSGTTVTESVYRHQLRPVLLSGCVRCLRTSGPIGTNGWRVTGGWPLTIVQDVWSPTGPRLPAWEIPTCHSGCRGGARFAAGPHMPRAERKLPVHANCLSAGKRTNSDDQRRRSHFSDPKLAVPDRSGEPRYQQTV